MNKSLIKQFIETYLKLNKVQNTIDTNKIYTVKFSGILANKLGKQRRFSFNREISDDYGVEYITLNNDLVKHILRDSIQKGQIVKAKLDVSILMKDKLNLDNNILIKSEKDDKETAIAFLFKVSSTNIVSENIPEFLRYIIVGYNDGYIFPEELAEEFHNLEFTTTNFQFDKRNITKTHTVAYEYLTEYLKSKYSEHENANKEFYNNRISELKERHEEFKRAGKFEEKKRLEKIKEYDYRIQQARSYEPEQKYREAKKKIEKELENLREKNQKNINENYIRTTKRIEEEESKYNFEVKVHLVSAIVFQYGIANLKLISTITNEECEITYNKFINQIQSYKCPTCRKQANELVFSIKGHFCCPNCSTYYQEKRGYLCEKDGVAKCMISGKIVPKTSFYKCYSCEQYYDKRFLKKDVFDKTVCVLCTKKLYNGEIINKKDAVFSKKYNNYFKPKDVAKCEYSGDYYPLKDLVVTTGSKKGIAKEFVRECKLTKLTFAPNEMKTKKTSNLASNLKEIETKSVKYDKIKEAVLKNKIKINENQNWVCIKIKGLLRSKFLLYNKNDKKISH